jgi:glycosyltransferase A (GT-A) superfamily protein (DUF2064 family)
MKIICVILKAPRVGTVKTRLAREIGVERATLIYRAMVEHEAGAIVPIQELFPRRENRIAVLEKRIGFRFVDERRQAFRHDRTRRAART